MRTDVLNLLAEIAGDDRLVHVERIPARAARIGELAEALPHDVWWDFGLPYFWTHQARGHRPGPRRPVGRRGDRHGVGQVALLPGADRRGREPASTAAARALLHLPDQGAGPGPAARARPTLGVPGLVAATYDGDTGPEARARGSAATPTSCSPTPRCSTSGSSRSTARWATFLRRLRYVVVDELHVFRGVFGTHVAHLLRRLRRLCAALRLASPTFIFSSATIGEPARLASALCGLPVVRGHRRRLAAGRAAVRALEPAAASIAATRHAGRRRERRGRGACAARPGRATATRTVAFCRSRQGHRGRRRPRCGAASTPTLAEPRPPLPRRLPPERAARDRGRAVRRPAPRRRRHHRARARHRRRRARRLRARRLPGHRSRRCGSRPAGPGGTTQRVARRARRRRRPARPVAHGPPRPGRSPGRPSRRSSTRPTPSSCSPTSPARPTKARSSLDDEQWWGDDLGDGVRQLVLDDRLAHPRPAPPVWKRAAARPAPGIGLRIGSSDEFRIAEATAAWSARSTAAAPSSWCIPGAIYLHQGQQYRVVALDLDERRGHRRAR